MKINKLKVFLIAITCIGNLTHGMGGRTSQQAEKPLSAKKVIPSDRKSVV